MIVLDACVLIAFTDQADVFHAAARRILATTQPMAMTALSGVEAMVHLSPQQRAMWLTMVAELGIEIVAVTSDDMAGIAAVRDSAGLKMPDAVIVWLAESRGAAIATFDERLVRAAKDRGLRTIDSEQP